eukprot:11546110-Heterocapsa_arctica.AAC.1
MESRDTGSGCRNGHAREVPGVRVAPVRDPSVGDEAHDDEVDAAGEVGDVGGGVPYRGGGIDDEAPAEQVVAS